MKPKPADFENAETSALAAELHIVLGALKRRLREHGDVADLTSAQKSVLLRLERDGHTRPLGRAPDHHFAHRSFPRLGEQGSSGSAGLAASRLAGAADRAGTA